MPNKPSMPEPVHLMVAAAASAVSHVLVPVRNLIDYLIRTAVAAALVAGVAWLLGYQ